MSNDSNTDAVRQGVLATFAEFGVAEAELGQMTETLLIRDGHYCGRSFRAGGLMAMAMGSLVQFYGPHGQMLRTTMLRAASQEASGKAA